MPQPAETQLTIGQCATLACLLEVAAPKPGNVHRGADFENLGFCDFVTSSVAIAPSMQMAVNRQVGRTARDAVKATQQLTGTNTNLGTILLLAPLATVPHETALNEGLRRVLAELTSDDATDIYAAIRHAQPGGMGEVDEADIDGQPPESIMEAMHLAADRDLVARQYTNGFEQVLRVAAPAIVEGAQRWGLVSAIVRTHVQLMAEFPDSLIARKCGQPTASQSASMAADVLSAGGPEDPSYNQALADLDFWLRSDGHRRNPGTTADMIAAGLFVALREGRLEPPFR